MYEFLLNSSIREKEQGNVEHIVSELFENYKRDLLKNHKLEIETYNTYATKHNRFICPTLENENKDQMHEVSGDEENESR